MNTLITIECYEINLTTVFFFSLFNHSKWPNKLIEARSDPAKKEELARHCSSNTDDALLLCKEVNTCMYDVTGKIKLFFLLCEV